MADSFLSFNAPASACQALSPLVYYLKVDNPPPFCYLQTSENSKDLFTVESLLEHPGCLFLIDGSLYIFRAFHAIPHLSNSQGIPTNAVYGFTTMLLKFLRQTQPRFVAMVFDAPGKTFRHETDPTYKGNRPELPPTLAPQFPYLYRVVKALRLEVLQEEGFEADDIIGTVATHMEAQKVDTVVVTGDKDLMQIVTPHVTLWDTMRDRRISTQEVRERFGVEPGQVADVLGLAGDPVDNIPGVRGVGEKTAAMLIRRFGTLENVLSHSSEIRGARRLQETLTAEAEKARLGKALATVRRDVPLVFDLERCRYDGPDWQELRRLCAELEFASLLRQLPSPGEPD
jgi:5'-3' exonuclease